MYLRINILLMLLLAGSGLLAQTRKVTGVVLNDKKQPVSGATIIEVNNEKNTTIADENGRFAIQLHGDRISISNIGYITQTAEVGNSHQVIVKLATDVKGLEDVVVIGYGRTKRITNTGAVSTIKGEEIKTVPTANVQNTLVGRMPGFFAQQRSGQPGADAAEFFIRGVNSLNGDNQPLIIVDDIEYDYTQLQQLNANEIESISILKDAATTSIYGLKGANGVLVITTQRGRLGKPRINITAERGINKVIRFPTFLDAYTTALLRNESAINDAYGQSQTPVMPFSQEDLQKFKDGSDPYGHPNVNWTEELLKKSSTQGRYNVDFSGGNKLVKYFTSLGYYTQNGILKEFKPIGDQVPTNFFYRRYNYRSNLDITPNKTTKIRFDINGRFETINNPGGVIDGAGLFYEISAFRYLAPYAMPLYNPDGSYPYATHVGNVGGWGAISPINRLANGGYKRSFRNNYNIVAGIDQRLDFITTGLSVKMNVSYAGNNNENRNLTRAGIASYYYNPVTETYSIRNAAEYRTPAYGVGVSSSAFNSTTILQAMLNYNRTFNGHHFTGLVLMNQRNFVDGGKIPLNYRGLTGRLDYDYKQKYLFGITVARNGNDLFREDRRFGIFPAISWGYNLAEEGFFKEALPFIDMFKIRGSYGLVGSDASYPKDKPVPRVIEYTTTGGNYYGGTTIEGELINTDITWEKEKKTDVGVELSMLNGKITLSGSYFYNFRYDQLIEQGDVPVMLGQKLPLKNIGKTENRGFDGAITYKNRIGQVDLSISANASYAVNKILYVSEAPDYPYLAKTGRAIGVLSSLGYHNIGFYQQEDFEGVGKLKKGVAAPVWSVIQPGDLRYEDLNGDGLITTADKTYLSKPNLPTNNLGLDLMVGYKGVTLRALFQGAYGYAVQVIAEGAGDAFNGNLRPWNLERWTPATAHTATYPRIGLNTNVNNISWITISDFWFTEAWYVRLRSVELAWQIPQSFVGRLKVVQNARMYLAGYNLLNYQRMGKFQQDAEIANGTGGAYPNTANFNFGVQLGF